MKNKEYSILEKEDGRCLFPESDMAFKAFVLRLFRKRARAALSDYRALRQEIGADSKRRHWF